MVRGSIGLVVGAMVLVGLASCRPSAPPAATEFLAVTVTTDSVDDAPGDGLCADAAGDCSLRAAVMEANANPNVTQIDLVAGETYQLSIGGAGEDAAASGDLDLVAETYVRVPAGGLATVDGGGLDRVFDAHSTGLHWFEGLQVRGGVASGAEPGGGILGRAGSVRLDFSWVTGNQAGGDGGGLGSVGAKLVLLDTTLESNTAGGNGGGVASSVNARIYQATIADNLAGGNGAGLWIGGGSADLKYSTLTDDVVALEVDGAVASVQASVLAGSTSCLVGPSGQVTSNGRNAASDLTCNLTGYADQPGVDVMLMPLGLHGGTTPTRVPYADSPVIDSFGHVYNGCQGAGATDQRGLLRRVNRFCDAGAVETQAGEAVGSDCPVSAAPVVGLELENCDLSGRDLAGRDLRGANLRSADLHSADLEGADLSGADLDEADLQDANLRDADVTGATLRAVVAAGADLTGLELDGATLEGANLVGVDLSGVDLVGAILPGADLSGADLEGLHLRAVDLGGATLAGANLRSIDLTDADLVGADLSGADLYGSDLSGADLSAAAMPFVRSGAITGVGLNLDRPGRPPGPYHLRSGYLVGPRPTSQGPTSAGWCCATPR